MKKHIVKACLNGHPSSDNMDIAIIAIQDLLRYKFHDPSLLVEALTHRSFEHSSSYERLEFLGDSVIGQVISNYLYLTYKDLDPGMLSLIRSANISTERLARVAVKYGLYQYVRVISSALDDMVREFTDLVNEEDNLPIYGGSSNAPKILADIVESLAAAVYVDCVFDLQRLWVVFRGLLEPFVTLEDIQSFRHPVTSLFELCQKKRQKLNFAYWKEGAVDFASVFVDDQLVASGSSNKKEFAKLDAANEALRKLDKIDTCIDSNSMDGPASKTPVGLAEAKQKLNDICKKRKWQKPTYKVEDERGPLHEPKYMSSVSINVGEVVLNAKGESKGRISDSERSAALSMHSCLRDNNYL